MHNRKNLGGGSLLSKKIAQLTPIILSIVITSFVCIQPTYAITLNEINIRRSFSTSSILSFNKSKLSSITWNIGNHKQDNMSDKTVYAIKIGDYGKAATYTGNICTAHFKNVGSIGGRAVNCDITFSNFHVDAISYKDKGEQKDGYIGLFHVFNNTDILGIGPTTSNSNYGYWASKRVDYTLKFMYEDGTVIDLPFVELISDIDSSYKYYQEGWAAVSGHSGNYWRYATIDSSGNYLNSFVDKNGTRRTPYPLVWSASGDNYTVKAPPYVSFQYETGGDAAIYCSGLYAESANGVFKSRYYFGNCGMNLRVYNQYSSELISQPKKSANKTSVNVGDTLNYTISYKMGTMYDTVLTPYKSLDITDKIPDEFSYVSATVTDEKGNDITSSAGTLAYNKSSNTVTYMFNQTWVNNAANYNGQTIFIKIKVKAKNLDAVSTKTTNQAEIMMEGNRVTLPSTNAGVEVVNAPKFQIIKRVKKDDYTDPHGCETFLFKIKSKKTGREWYRSVTFKDSDKSASGYWTFSENGDYEIATGKVEELPIGDEYDISEVSVSRYREVSKKIKVDGRLSTYTFENEKDNWKNYSHNDIVINTTK